MIDSFFEENQGEYILQVKDGLLEIIEDGEYEVSMKLDISELSSLLMGVVYSKVEISDSSYLNILNSIFNTLEKPICITPF